MSNLRAAITIVTVLSIVGCTRAPKENSDAEKAALESAEDWLALVDTEKYVESWETTLARL